LKVLLSIQILYSKGLIDALEEFKKCHMLDPNISIQEVDSCIPHSRAWQSPPLGFIKVNWDAAINTKDGCITLKL